MPLSIAAIGEENCIERITGRDDVKNHLAKLGLVAGKSVSVVSRLNGNIILSVGEGRIALDKALACRILVRRNGA